MVTITRARFEIENEMTFRHNHPKYKDLQAVLNQIFNDGDLAADTNN
jgi:hypothetical protein